MRYVISVGANLDDPDAAVAAALAYVPKHLEASDWRASSRYGTSPVGGPAQPDYVNAVLVVESRLTPDQVLERLQELERRAGRQRDVRWGPRTLDLDIITVDAQISGDPNLTLPHPRAHERGFVLVPWFEIEPQAELPTHGKIRDLIGALDPSQRVHMLERPAREETP